MKCSRSDHKSDLVNLNFQTVISEMGLRFFIFVTASVLPMAIAIGPLASFGVGNAKCEPSVTTSSGTFTITKPKDKPTQHCAGELIFEDIFDTFDLRKWQHENTLSGGRVSIVHSLLSWIF